ncbi:YkuS family protein [Oceanobacillus salinisoli]|uniref:YkuS family protein n=1 Tax=Oceanobacillus salinisoli TaxID=2678611 RepID=UPI0012E25142|nr:YkuS family protein [Oceanobacillus salinisoli]
MARIGVEGTLTDVKAALMEMGHEVVDLRTEEDVNGCDCCIISGQDKDVMGMADTSTDASVINAHGFEAQDIVQMVNEKLS